MMSRTLKLLQAWAARPLTRWVGLPALSAVGLVFVWAQTVPAALPPTVNLASEPLYARSARAKPTLTLALSVEFPTVGAQYVGTPGATEDASYSPDNQYIGYYDSESCYLYKRDGDASSHYFVRSGPATDRQCGGKGFSGNFMNWATSSAIDVLRLGLTGGDRVLDTENITVLQRAVLPTRDSLPGKNDTFWNGVNFPSKQVSGDVATGALPRTLTGDNPGTIYVANCLNQIYFGTQKDGSCGSPGNNGNLGVDQAAVPATGMYRGALPSDFSSAFASESSGTEPSYTVTGTQQIAYGSGSTWAVVTKTGGSVACSNAAWATYGVPGLGSDGDPTPNTAKECRRRTAPADGAGTATQGLTPDPYFYARVQVCDSSAGVLSDPRADLCQRYPNGNYKPVGHLQKHSDSVRVAVFGYLNDNTDNPQRSGGVLRAPMKYVGARAYDANYELMSGANQAQEWDEKTGQFVANPERLNSPRSGQFSSAPGQTISGAINYLNQFGRTGDVLGRYKIYDPVGELYYESLRYLQGLQPTQVGSSIATNVVKDARDYQDGFPVYTKYTDPHPKGRNMTDYSCVRNNIVGIGDVNSWNDKFIPGNPDSRTGSGDVGRKANEARNEPDFWAWTRVVGGFESNAGFEYTDGAGVSGRKTSNPNTPNDAARNLENADTGSGQTATYYIAGMAYWANTHDIRGKQWTINATDDNDESKQRPGMRVTTYWIDVNEFGEQSDPAKRRASNQFYLAAKYGGFKDVTGTGNPYKKLDATGQIVDDPANLNWERKSSNPDLQEAKNYFLASSAQSVIDALNEIFENIAAEANSIAGAAISTSQVTDDATGLVYQAKFDPADWSGDLVAYTLSLSSDQQVVISDKISSVWAQQTSGPAMGVAGRLEARDPSTRDIYVGYNAGATPTFASSAFVWDKVDDTVKKALQDPDDTSSTPAKNRLNYLRGDHTQEAGGSGGGKLRKRSSRLGDIVNSGIVYVAGPSQAISEASYAQFYDAVKSRAPALYVGANDGMLHAFSATTGEELFAYIPSWVVPNLKELTKSSYKHRSYVDATPAVAEANLGTTASADWRTVLVGGTGGGGQGVYALDVSNPEGFDNANVLWEFTDRDDVDMGNVIGTPRIVKMNVAAGSATPDYRYFAVVASGVNNHATDGRASTTGEPALFFLQLGKGKTDAWELGRNYYKVKFPVVSNDSALPSGLISFSVRGDLSGAVTAVYAGDLQGNLWKLDFRSTPAEKWTLNALSAFKNASGNAIPLYVATDGTSLLNRQPISMPPTLTFGPMRNSIIVSFGTGRYLSEDDNRSPFRTQSVYAVLDDNTNTADTADTNESNLPEAAIQGRGRLRQVVINATQVTSSPFSWGRPSSGNASTLERAGWYFDFDHSGSEGTSAGTGERQIGGFVVQSGRLIFGSVIPAVNSCDNGSGVQYQVGVLSGNGTAIVSTIGVLGEPLLVQVGSSALSASDPTGVRDLTTTHQSITPTSGGLMTSPPFSGTTPTGRLSWREVSNYQDLRNAR